MTNLKFLFLFLFASLVLVGCGDDDEEVIDNSNTLEIIIEDPVNDAVFAAADCGSIHVHVDFVASVENHTVTVIVHPEDDVTDRVVDFELHDHDTTLTFSQDIDLCAYPAGTCFHVETSACVDHDCLNIERSEAEFCMEQ